MMFLVLSLAQMVMCFLVAQHCASAVETHSRRWKFWLLAFALMCLGAWNFLAGVAPAYAVKAEWMRQTGHLALLVFAGFYLYTVPHKRSAK